MKIKPWLAGALVALQCGLTQAASLGIGAAWPTLSLNDQHDKPVALDPARLGTVVFAAERKPGDWAQEVIDQFHQETVKTGSLALILDVSRMPSMITKMFALPALRERSFSIVVVREGEQVVDLPRQDGAVTVLTLVDGKVTAIDYAHDPAALRRLLATPPSQSSQTKEKP